MWVNHSNLSLASVTDDYVNVVPKLCNGVALLAPPFLICLTSNDLSFLLTIAATLSPPKSKI